MSSPTSPQPKCKVHFTLRQGPLDEHTPWPPLGGESLWGEIIGERSARLLNSPFYAKDVSYLDEVRLGECVRFERGSDDDGADFFEFDGVLKHSGHGTVRVILRSEQAMQMAEAAVEEVRGLGCVLETTGDCLVSIDIPPGVQSTKVMAALENARAADAIYVEVGFLPDDGKLGS